MEVKFKKKLSDYDYLVMFDLATGSTGVCAWNLASARPAFTENLTTTGKTGNRAGELWDELDRFFMDFASKLGLEDFGRVIVHRELCPIQQGRFTTAKTLISLGKSHAVLDLYLREKGLDYYDLDGVSPSTTHAHFRGLAGLGPKDKVTKEMVRDYLVSEYGIDPRTGLDETDSVFLAKTFVERFWDKEIDEEKRNVRRHIKTLKAPAAIAKATEGLAFLDSLKTSVK